jgi:hypothetical protein
MYFLRNPSGEGGSELTEAKEVAQIASVGKPL